MKDTFYFPHDYNPRSDDKIKPLLRKFGMTGYGIFWAIIEDLYINANALRTDYECIAFDLRVDENTVKSIINDFDLFQISGEYFGSLSVERRLNERAEKSLKAKNSANERWNKNANGLQPQSDGNAKKERKGKEKKEIKENNIEARAKIFYNQVAEFKTQYTKEMLRKFYEYWIEPNKSKTKMRFELERTWDLSRRLTTWADREKVTIKPYIANEEKFVRPSAKKLN